MDTWLLLKVVSGIVVGAVAGGVLGMSIIRFIIIPIADAIFKGLDL